MAWAMVHHRAIVRWPRRGRIEERDLGSQSRGASCRLRLYESLRPKIPEPVGLLLIWPRLLSPAKMCSHSVPWGCIHSHEITMIDESFIHLPCAYAPLPKSADNRKVASALQFIATLWSWQRHGGSAYFAPMRQVVGKKTHSTWVGGRKFIRSSNIIPVERNMQAPSIAMDEPLVQGCEEVGTLSCYAAL